MAPTRGDGNRENTKQGGKRKWVPERKVFEGSVNEGRGFAFKRKEKVKHEYNKLLRKDRKRQTGEAKSLYQEEYPEHLKHLYIAEAQKLKSEAWTNRVNRSKHRMKGKQAEVEEEDNDEAAVPETEATASSAPETKETLPMSNRMKKKLLRKTSYQKTKEEFEKAKEKKQQKRESFLVNKKQREEAVQKYKQKKMETFQMLSKRTKKGQPNLNLQMEYLLQKIQKS